MTIAQAVSAALLGGFAGGMLFGLIVAAVVSYAERGRR